MAARSSLRCREHCRRIQETWESRQTPLYNIAQGSVEESRYYLILAKDLEYGDVSELSRLLEEVSKLLEAYSQAILTSEF